MPPSPKTPARDLTPTKVNVDFPAWVVAALDEEADRIGIARQALIKLWIVERLEQCGWSSAAEAARLSGRGSGKRKVGRNAET